MADKGVLTIYDPKAAAVAAELERLRPPQRRREIDMEAVRRIQAEVRSWLVVDDRPADELIGCNEYGLFDK